MAKLATNYVIFSNTNAGALIPSADGNGVEIGKAPGIPALPKYVWEFLPCINDNHRFYGLLIRNRELNKVMRADPNHPDGNGVALVPLADADDWCTWVFNPTTSQSTSVATMPLISGPTYNGDNCDLTLYGGGPWGVGSQAITYRWTRGDNQIWWLVPNPV